MAGFTALAMEGSRLELSSAAPLIVLAVSIAVNLILCRVLFEWNARTKGARRFLALLAALPFAVAVALW